MAMLTVECCDCHEATVLRGWVEPEDLKGTQWERYTQEEIKEAESKNPLIFWGLDPWDKFDQNPVCPNCGSDKVISY